MLPPGHGPWTARGRAALEGLGSQTSIGNLSLLTVFLTWKIA